MFLAGSQSTPPKSPVLHALTPPFVSCWSSIGDTRLQLLLVGCQSNSGWLSNFNQPPKEQNPRFYSENWTWFFAAQFSQKAREEIFMSQITKGCILRSRCLGLFTVLCFNMQSPWTNKQYKNDPYKPTAIVLSESFWQKIYSVPLLPTGENVPMTEDQEKMYFF